MQKMQKSTRDLINFIISLALGVAVILLMGGTDLSVQGQRMVGVMVAIMYIWISGCMPLAASCFVLIILETFAVTDFTGTVEGGMSMSSALSATLSSFASTTPMTVIVGTALAAVVKSSGLAERIVYLIHACRRCLADGGSRQTGAELDWLELYGMLPGLHNYIHCLHASWRHEFRSVD